MNLLNDIFGTELNGGIKLLIVFAVLLVVLLLVVWLVRIVFGNNVSRMASNRQRRLAVTDAAIVDNKRRLILVRRDNVEHLVLIGGKSDVLLESNISRVTPVQVPATGKDSDIATKKMPNHKTQNSTEQKELPSKKRPLPFSMIKSSTKKADQDTNLAKKSAVGVTAIGAAALAATNNTTAKTLADTTSVAGSVSDSVADSLNATKNSILDKAINKAIKKPTVGGDKIASHKEVSDKDVRDGSQSEVNKITNPASTETQVDEVTSNIVDVPIVDKIKEVNLELKGATEKSAAEIDLEMVLADDVAISNSSSGEDDMQKILDELTADIK